ncbi:uncharacterized protein [Pleurodeles waltl]|uniref:uncharacterized protein n=1 Tax=Pleurodeles waltl TaxID=8319 RepID=UPI003709B484
MSENSCVDKLPDGATKNCELFSVWGITEALQTMSENACVAKMPDGVLRNNSCCTYVENVSFGSNDDRKVWIPLSAYREMQEKCRKLEHENRNLREQISPTESYERAVLEESFLSHSSNEGVKTAPSCTELLCEPGFLADKMHSLTDNTEERAKNVIYELPLQNAKVKRKILEKETPSFISLFDFWKKKSPHLREILTLLYMVTVKNYMQLRACDLANEIMQTLGFCAVQEGNTYVHVIQEQGKKIVPLARIIQWIWYLQDRARVPQIKELPMKLCAPFEFVSTEDKKHVCFTNDSLTEMLFSATVEGTALYNVCQILKQELHEMCHFYADFWFIANVLAPNWFNYLADVNEKNSEREVYTQNSALVGMAKWVPQKCEQLREKATYRSYHVSPLSLSVLCGPPSGVCVWGRGRDRIPNLNLAE